MARPHERRAALERVASVEPAAVIATNYGPPAMMTEDESPMKIQFTHVYFQNAIQRLPGGDKGLAASSSTFFDVEKLPGLSIELDTATQLVRLSNSQGECFVPLAKVERFGPMLAAAKSNAA